MKKIDRMKLEMPDIEFLKLMGEEGDEEQCLAFLNAV